MIVKNQRTTLFLMANLGAEVSRLLSFKEKGDHIEAKEALKRAQDILFEIKKLPEMRKRLQEIDILSAVIADILETKPIFHVSPRSIKSYFQPFTSRMISGLSINL